jgi:RNA polymerase sigma-70 factor (ECF subfamily)
MPSPENSSEEVALLTAIAGGDRPALRELYSRYSAPLYTLAVRLVGDSGAAEEILQDTFVKIWRHAGNFDARKSRPFTWAVTILRRTCIDWLRRNRRHPSTTPFPEDDAVPAELSTHETSRQSAEAREAAALLRTTLANIPPPQRNALELALFSTLTHAEIATRLDQPTGTVKTWIRRGLLELRNTLTHATS